MSLFRHLLSPKRSAPGPRRSLSLAVEELESRLVPSYTFNTGILIINADSPSSNDVVHIRAAGTASDGTTGVQVDSNLVNGGSPTTIGGPGTPVVRIALDLKDGNDTVSIAGLAQTKIRVGEGNGNNSIRVGDSLNIAVAAGNGHNSVKVGGGTDNSLAGIAPGNILSPAGTVVELGWSYRIDSAGGLFTPFTPIGGNLSRNKVVVGDHEGQSAVVDIAGDGSNSVSTGNGNDIVWIQGNGDNHIKAEAGTNQIQVDGNGDNHIRASGAGTITVNGRGDNRINAGANPSDAVFLNFTGKGGRNHVQAAVGAHVEVNGKTVTSSGKYDNTHTFVQFGKKDDDGRDDM